MRRIVLTNRKMCIRRHLAKGKANFRFMLLEESTTTIGLKRYLAKKEGVGEITKTEAFGDHKEGFQKEFCSTLRFLNRKNGSVEWWAMNFTNKNPMISGLFRNTAHFLCVWRFATDYPDLSLIVLSGNKALARQLRVNLEAAGIIFHSDISARGDIKGIIRSYTPLLIMLTFLKVVFRKLLSNVMLSKETSDEAQKSIIVTQFEDSSICRDGVYRDVYFGDFKDLINELAGVKDLAVLTIGYVACRFATFLKRLKKRRENINIYPMEYFISGRDIFRALLKSIGGYSMPFRRGGDYKIFGLSLTTLLRNEVAEAVSSGQVFVNLAVYFSFLSLFNKSRADVIYYPFENRSWEKMLILARNTDFQNARLIGYQHSSIIPRHLNFYLEPGESVEMPMPDIIVTAGQTTKDIMKRWNFPEALLRVGCALRHRTAPHTTEPKISRRKKEIKNILVALASNIEEYVQALSFLDEALGHHCPYDILIRPHPIISFKKAVTIFKPRRLKYRLSNASLSEDLAGCDVLLYASSTVCLEAIALGKPVIYLALDNLLNSDPLFFTDALKERCSAPGELVGLIKKIEAAGACDSDDEVRQEALQCANRYFGAVNKENLTKFLI